MKSSVSSPIGVCADADKDTAVPHIPTKQLAICSDIFIGLANSRLALFAIYIAYYATILSLYVSNTDPKKWMRYPVKTDSTLGLGVVFVDASSDNRFGSPDGIKVDTKGNLYAAGPGGVWIISAEGKHLGTIIIDTSTANVAWGGPHATTLFITSSDAVYSIRLKIRGIMP
jgi:SMP-30/Gluconolactonase/LRE-like region